MNQFSCRLFAAVWICLWIGPAFVLLANPISSPDPSTNLTRLSDEVPDRIEPFTAESLDGQRIDLQPTPADQPGTITIVCFVGNDCPLVKLYAPRLSQLAVKWPKERVRLIGINSNPQDTDEAIRTAIESLQVEFPVIKDADQSLLRRFGASRTPEIFVLDPQLMIQYHGRVDDQYLPGIAKPQATRNDLITAVTELLEGKSVSVPETPFAGCLIGKIRDVQPSSLVTFNNQISRLLQQHCWECHRDHEIAPFALVDYEDVQGWSDMILEVVDNGRMPPWHAAPGAGEFHNARGMTDSDKQLLRDWVVAGMPRGEGTPPTPPTTQPREWRLPREPDAVVAMASQAFVVPAEGTVDYQYYVVDPGWQEDRWVVGAEVIPGNRAVVHHSIVFIRPPDGEQVAGLGWLAAYVPGQHPSPYPAGHGRFVPAGSKLVFQQHYTPNGREHADITRIGLLFAPADQITHQIYTMMGINQEFEIPPQAEAHPVSGKIDRLPEQAVVLGYSPHMHYRGKSFELAGVSGSQRTPLLDVPRYDFNWQHFYELKQPVPLRQFERLEFTAKFDNSAANPANPNPAETVMWGDQSWEEMAVVFVEVAQPLGPSVVVDRGLPVPRSIASAPIEDPFSAAERVLADQWIEAFIARFAGDGQDFVRDTQLPEAIRRFSRLDSDGDGRITRAELEPHARQRFLWHDERQTDRDPKPQRQN